MLASIRSFHATWAWVVIIGNAVAGLWALSSIRLPSLRTRALWWFTACVEVAVAVQVTLGVAAMRMEDRAAATFHQFYGFVALITVGILYSYRQQLQHRLQLMYGLGGLFLMGLGIRAMLKA